MDYLDVPLQITIPKTEEGKDKEKTIILYNIHIQIGNTSTIWQVKKRYSMFRELYDRLRAQFPETVNATNFPPKIWLKLTPEEIEERRLGLQTWLQTVVSTTELVNTWELQYFLEIKTHLVGRQYNGKKVLVPLPDKDFDPTETAVTWKILRLEGFEVIFATEKGMKPTCDELPLTEDVIFGQLGIDYEPSVFYREMEQDPYFRNPVVWSELDPQDFHALFLTGGHAGGMKQYLESKDLQKKIVAFWKLKRPVGAISQGTLLLGRSRDEENNNKSILCDKVTSTLPHYLEMLAYYITSLKYGNYYKAYEVSVEEEMKRYLDHPDLQLKIGDFNVSRGSAFDSKPAFYCEDAHYISARWPGGIQNAVVFSNCTDAYLFARKFAQKIFQTKYQSFFAYENEQQ